MGQTYGYGIILTTSNKTARPETRSDAQCSTVLELNVLTHPGLERLSAQITENGKNGSKKEKQTAFPEFFQTRGKGHLQFDAKIQNRI